MDHSSEDIVQVAFVGASAAVTFDVSVHHQSKVIMTTGDVKCSHQDGGAAANCKCEGTCAFQIHVPDLEAAHNFDITYSIN